MTFHLRVARPVRDLAKMTAMYCEGVALDIVGSFEGHDGFDGVMLGVPKSDYHFEFTHCRTHAVMPTPTAEDLVVLYIPSNGEWHTACERMLAAGFRQVVSFNPYWDAQGRTFEDPDGYRVVLQNDQWRNAARG